MQHGGRHEEMMRNLHLYCRYLTLSPSTTNDSIQPRYPPSPLCACVRVCVFPHSLLSSCVSVNAGETLLSCLVGPPSVTTLFFCRRTICSSSFQHLFAAASSSLAHTHKHTSAHTPVSYPFTLIYRSPSTSCCSVINQWWRIAAYAVRKQLMSSSVVFHLCFTAAEQRAGQEMTAGCCAL